MFGRMWRWFWWSGGGGVPPAVNRFVFPLRILKRKTFPLRVAKRKVFKIRVRKRWVQGMSSDPTFHVADLGTEIVVKFLDESSVVVNIAAATLLEITLEPPAGANPKVLTAVLDTTGVDGQAKITTDATTLDSEGIWDIQGRTTVGGKTWKTEKTSFVVGP